MADLRSCGQGLAANAALPAKLGELTAALADVLETHTKALDLDDENARQERNAYLQLANDQRQTAAELLRSSEAMAGYRDLPVARHDPTVMASAEVADAFEKFVSVEHELLALLEDESSRIGRCCSRWAGRGRAARSTGRGPSIPDGADRPRATAPVWREEHFRRRLPRCCDQARMVDRAATAASGCCGVARNPTGPDTALADPASPDIPLRVLKGGSFLCADNYCLRYRPAARIPRASDSGAVYIGFRCIRADQAAWFHATKRRRGDAMHRVLFAIHRKPELSFEEFVEHYREVHIPIARRLPRLRHYEIFPVVPAPDGDESSPDAFAIMTFDSAEDFEVVLGTPEMAEAVKDNETFIGGFETYVVDHLPVIPD